MKSSFSIEAFRNMFIQNNRIEEIHVMPEGALIYRMNSKMADQLMEYNMFRVDKCYRDILLDGFRGKSLDNLVKIYGEENINSKVSHAYFNELIDFSENTRKENIKVIGSEKAFYPPHMAIELTDICNLSCKHCYRQAGYKGKYIDFEELKKLILKMKEKGLKLVEITGGEPTLHPQFPQIIQFLCENLSLVAILTNGTNITDEMLEVFKKNRKKIMVNISLDSSSAEFHDKFRGKTGAWETTVDSLKKISGIPILTRVAMSIVPDNMFDIEKTIKLAQKNGAKSFAWEVSNTNGRGSNISWNKVTEKNYENFVKESKYLQAKYHEMITFIPPKCTKKMQQGCDNCGAGWRTFALDPYGELRTCVNGDNDMFKFGNIFVEGIEIFEKTIITELSKVGVPRYETCKNCKNFSYCQGCFIKGVDGALSNPECEWEGKRLLKYVDRKNYRGNNVEKCITQRSLRH